jgi:hypothetical protein
VGLRCACRSRCGRKAVQCAVVWVRWTKAGDWHSLGKAVVSSKWELRCWNCGLGLRPRRVRGLWNIWICRPARTLSLSLRENDEARRTSDDRSRRTVCILIVVKCERG